jgi:hypothetical protein
MKALTRKLDVVAVLRDHPDRHLVAGQVGTVVEILGRDAYEVEFVDTKGRTYATAALKGKDLIVLHYTAAAAV